MVDYWTGVKYNEKTCTPFKPVPKCSAMGNAMYINEKMPESKREILSYSSC